MTNQRIFDRRAMLRSAAAGLGAALVTTTASACAPDERTAPMPGQNPGASAPAQDIPSSGNRRRVLLAYFSRASENYYYGGRTDLDIGQNLPQPTIGQRLAVQGEKVQDAGPNIQAWLQRTGLLCS